MGNSTSAENPRRAPQKLSKPRVGNLSASPTSHTGSHSSPSVDGARFANSYLVGSLPLPLGDGEARSKSAEAIPQLDELKFFDDDSQEDPKSPTDVSRSSSAPPQQQLLERRKSTGLSLGPSNELSRRQSIIQPLARASTIGTLSTRRSSHFDPIAYEACLLREGLSGGKVEGVSPTGSQHEIHEATEAGWAEASLQEDQFSPVHRTRSEASLFTTTRRRSMIQIPGVATRPQPKLPSPEIKSKHRKSLPLLVNEEVEEDIDDFEDFQRHRRLTMPPQALGSPDERASTPVSVAEYQQIGGMQFGTLRITNGRPESTHSSPRASMTRRRHRATFSHSSKLSREYISPSSSAAVTPAEERSEETMFLGVPSVVIKPAIQEADDVLEMPIKKSTSELPANVSQPPGSADVGAGPASPTRVDAEASSTKSSTKARSFETDGEDKPPYLEVLDVRDDASAKGTSTPNDSESGMLSTSSSKSSKTPLSKSDSGYGSSVSLQSFFSIKKKSKKVEEPPASRPTLQHHTPFQSQTQVTGSRDTPEDNAPPATPTKVETTPPFIPAEVIGRTSSLKSMIARGTKQSNEGAKTHSRTGSSGTQKSAKSTKSNRSGASRDESETPKQGKLRRLLSGTRRKNTTYTTDSLGADTPPVPSNAEEMASKHNGTFATVVPIAEPPTVRPQSSKETLPRSSSLRTAPNTKPRPVSESFEAARWNRSANDAGNRRHSHVPHPFSSPALSRSNSKASNRPRSGLRKSRSVSKKTMQDCSDSDEEVPLYGVQTASIDNIRRSVGNSAFDQAFASMHDAQGPYAAAFADKPAYHSPPRAQHRPPRLRPRSSAPDFLATVPEPSSASDIMALKQPKTPPPISLRTRGSRKSKRRSTQPSGRPYYSSQAPPPLWQTNFEAPPLLAHSGPRSPGGQPLPPAPQPHRYDGYQPAHHRPLFASQNEPGPGRRMSAHGRGSQGGHARNRSASAVEDTKGPYRTMQGHNPSAHQGVAIWG